MIPEHLLPFSENIPVLDHGWVRLVDVMGDDKRITSAARCSTGKEKVKYKKGRNRKLMRYMLRHGHTSPFEMCEIVLHCKMPIFVARQWVRQRTASLNEYSGRYSEMPNEMYVPGEWRYQDSVNKQGSSDALPSCTQEFLDSRAREMHKDLYDLYIERLKQLGVSKEQARMDLPLSQYTQWYWKIDLHNLFGFLRQRLHSHAQWEIRQYAQVIADIVKKWVPTAWEAFEDYVLYAQRFSLEEINIIKYLFDEHNITVEELSGVAHGLLDKEEATEFMKKFE